MPRYSYFVHYHKPFILPEDSHWVKPAVYEDQPQIIGNGLILSKFNPNIRTIFKKFEPLSDDQIGYYSQTVALEYWVSHHVSDADYVGVSSYRRYPLINKKYSTFPYLTVAATKENISSLTHESNLKFLDEILKLYEIITVKKIQFNGSIKDQFIQSQRLDIWEAFIEGIIEIAPEYKKWIDWFNFENQIHFCGPMGFTPLHIFKEYNEIYTKIINYMLVNLENPFLCENNQTQLKTDRWIGYMSERFYPFFLFVNNFKIFEMPMVILA